jgi:hypothetical protein
MNKPEDISKLCYATYQPIQGKLQDNIEKIKDVMRSKVSSSLSRFISLVIAFSLFGLIKEDWDKGNEMLKLKEFEDLLFLFKILLKA